MKSLMTYMTTGLEYPDAIPFEELDVHELQDWDEYRENSTDPTELMLSSLYNILWQTVEFQNR